MRTKTLILPWTAGLVAIGLIDLFTSLVWLHQGCIVEFNPIMSKVLNTSLVLFVAVKISTLCAYVIVVEWYRRHRSASFARVIGIVTVTSYLTIYAISFCSANFRFFFG